MKLPENREKGVQCIAAERERIKATRATYGYKVLVDEATDRILEAHLVGPHMDKVINLFALAIRHGLTADDLKTTMFAYPTGAPDIGAML